MSFERTDEPRGPGATDRDGRWREIAPVVATSDDGLIYGHLETRREEDPRHLALELQRARREARRSAYLLAAAGHDLRQPLQVILLALDRFAPPGTGAGGADWLAVARAEVGSLAASLTDLARAARLAEPTPTPTPLGELLRKAAGGWRQHAMAKGLRLVVVDCGLTLRVDPQLLLTAVRNLIGNAVSHTRSGRILVGVRRGRGEVRIDVIDSGPGLDVDAARVLFEPHQRGSTESEGLGLGLAIVRDAAERLGAGLSLASAPGLGARFSLTLPIDPG